MPVDSAYSGRASVRCLRPSPVKMLGGDRRLSMNLGLSLLVKAQTQVLPAHARTKTKLLLSVARSRPWSLERQSREGCPGPLSFDRPFRRIPFPSAPPPTLVIHHVLPLMNVRIYVSYAGVMSWFAHILLSLSTCRHIVCPFLASHSYPPILNRSTRPLRLTAIIYCYRPSQHRTVLTHFSFLFLFPRSLIPPADATRNEISLRTSSRRSKLRCLS